MQLRPGRAGALVDSPDGVRADAVRRRVGAVGDRGDPRAGRADLVVRGRVRRRPRRRGRHGRGHELGGSYRGTDPVRAVLERGGPRLLRLGRAAPAARDAAGDERRADRRDVVRPARRRPTTSPSTWWPRRAWPAGCSCPSGPGAGVVVVGGSDGGPGGPVMAALLAGHGVPVLSMAYWGHPGTPDALRDIDVEVVGPRLRLAAGAGRRRRRAAVRDRPVPRRRAGPAGRGPDPRRTSARWSSRWAAGSPGAPGGRGPTCCETAWRFGGEPVPQMAEDEDDPNALHRRRGHGGDGRDRRRARGRTGADAQRGGRRDVAERAAHPDRRGARRARGRRRPGHPRRLPRRRALLHDAAGLPARRPSDAIRSGGSRSRNQAARLDAWRRILEFVGATR